MLETETFNEIVPYSDYINQLEDSITEEYPQLSLPNPLSDYTLSNNCVRMNSEEKQFAKLLLSRDMIVYREPRIELCDSIPDFFVYNPRTTNGKLVEITLSKMETGDKRKRRQIRNLELCGIPFVILFREQMERIRKYSWHKLF